MDSLVVTIDGPAGSGKSTAARMLARQLGFQFLDTGAMYRIVAWSCLQNDIELNDQHRVGEHSRDIRISFRSGKVLANDIDVTDAIRTAEVTEGSSIVAANPVVREGMAELQRLSATGANIVTEGRDQGTVVFPDAFCKFFLTATPETRAQRRHDELARRGVPTDLSEILHQIRERDARDEQREIAPLRAADDAETIDTSMLDCDEVVELLESRIRRRLTEVSADV